MNDEIRNLRQKLRLLYRDWKIRDKAAMENMSSSEPKQAQKDRVIRMTENEIQLLTDVMDVSKKLIDQLTIFGLKVMEVEVKK